MKASPPGLARCVLLSPVEMAHLWMRRPSAVDAGQSVGEWVATALEGEAFRFAANAAHLSPTACEDGTTAMVLRSRGPDGESWVLVGSDTTRINGAPLLSGIRVLADRDEVQVGGQVFFSTEHLACVEPFPGAGQPIFCPRCKQEIALASPAVQCPGTGCRVWHHQSDDLPCWTYAERCALCDQPTETGTTYRWTPEEI